MFGDYDEGIGIRIGIGRLGRKGAWAGVSFSWAGAVIPTYNTNVDCAWREIQIGFEMGWARLELLERSVRKGKGEKST